MRKIISLFICCLLIVLPGCSTKYKRISFESKTLGEKFAKHIDENTMVVHSADDSFPDKLPIYKISERKISENELNKTLGQFGIGENNVEAKDISLDGNRIEIEFPRDVNSSAEEVNITEEELERLAWEAFNKLTFIEGEYKYYGIRYTHGRSDSTGTHTIEIGVSFRRVLDDVRIIGEDRCFLYFDSTGLLSVHAKLYDYKKIGTMDLVPLESASLKIKQPDSFSIDTAPDEAELGMLDKLEVEKNTLMYVNQYANGCTILEPVYSYSGTATDINGKKDDFSSKIIAIPESYTYD